MAHEINIEELEQAPAMLKALVVDEAKDISTIKSIIFGAYMENMEGKVGMYYPATNALIIDMGNALKDMNLFNKGMMYIPSTWYILIFAIGHEICHALQFEAEPKLIEYETLPQEYDDEANEYGNEVMMQYAQAHGRVPEPEEMGWIGEQIIVMINDLYHKAPDITDEVTYMRAGAAANLDELMATYNVNNADDMELKEHTINDVDKGVIGIKIDGKRFLNAYEFLGFI